MPSFLTLGCETTDANFFTSANYTRPSFSRTWATNSTPDTDVSDTPIYLLVLDTYNIPYDSGEGLPPAGTLPGVDIKRMDAFDAIRFSLAEPLVLGQWWEMYEDNFGGVFFQQIYNGGSPGKTVSLDVRQCIPTAKKDNEVDMVIVHGYAPPPETYPGEFKDVVPAGLGEVNPTSINGDEVLITIDFASMLGTCHSKKIGSVVKSYRDPLIMDVWGPQEKNPFYDVKAYESVSTYAVRISGMPEDPEGAVRVKYKFEQETTWYLRLPSMPTFSRTLSPEVLAAEECGMDSSNGIVTYRSVYEYTSPNFIDRYGFNWQLVDSPTRVLYAGYKILQINALGAASLSGSFREDWYVYVSGIPEFIENKEWYYTIPGINQFNIVMYYQPKVAPEYWDVILNSLSGGNPDVVVHTYARATSADFASSPGGANIPFSQASIGILPGGEGYGYYITDCWLGFTLKRPSVIVADSLGDSLHYAELLRVEYAPLIVRNRPAEIAYKHKDAGLVLLGLDELAEDLPDSDPTTCQNFEETHTQRMQNLVTGNTLEVSFPFCKDKYECASAAATIFDVQNHAGVQTFNLSCGPSSQPELGAAVEGFDSDLRIESINYSYQDASSYTIDVTLGPVFSASNKGWSASAWERKVEEVTRPAVIVWSAGDGANYRVRIKGLGEYNAINSARERIWRVGEIVEVTVFNVPVEE